MRTSPAVEEQVLRARQTLRAGPAWLSAFTGVPERMIGRILRRHGVPCLWECDPLTGEPLKTPPGPVVRYERNRPGELLHMDVKKLSSIPPAGDGRNTAAATPPPGERDGPLRTPMWTTTPASPTPKRYQTRKEPPSPLTIKPYHPQQNDKVERYDQTLKPKWANSQPWPDNQTRNQALHHWLHYYHNHRPHHSLGGKPPTSRL